MKELVMNNIITIETARLEAILSAIERYHVDRKEQLDLHDSRMKTLESERLDALGWKEKNELTEKMIEHAKFDPRKYLIPFENIDSPYFGIVGINDTNPTIKQKEYLLGKQSLTEGNRVIIVDWRKAEVSRLYYEWEEGDEYEEDIKGVERTGVITHRRNVTIAKKVLTGITTANDHFRFVNGEWRGKDGSVYVPASAEIKTTTGDHHLIDIVALIQPEQFQAITKKHHGCTYLTGDAGCGKTTVAEHQLSYLQFNHPEQYQPERCLVLVFNKTLKDYVRKSSSELLGKTPVETFSAWAKRALQEKFRCGNFRLSTEAPGYDEIKKSALLAELLERYIWTVPVNGLPPLMDLFRFYCSQTVVSAFKHGSDMQAYYRQFASPKDNQPPILPFSDLGPLLRLCQLRTNLVSVDSAFNHYQHIIADEAQDFSEIELEAIYGALDERKSITICADEKQRLLPAVDPTGFTRFMKKLLAAGLDATTFQVGYRSAPDIMRVANHVAGKAEKPDRAKLETAGVVSFQTMTNKPNALTELVSVVKEFQSSDPSSLTAVICKAKTDFESISTVLKEHGVTNIHPPGQIAFSPGVVIINAHQVKGLEFTNVVLWNPSTRAYRKTDTDRSLLYVAISRACKRLTIIHHETLSSWFS